MVTLATRTFAGITVPDTELINKALAYARTHCDDMTYNHVMRSWLFGSFIAAHIPHLQNIDKELHAIVAILHDLGWTTNPEFISPDKRFEVDGANATRQFILAEGKPEEWDIHRVQLAWDAIALHTTPSIAFEKEAEVHACCVGIFSDFLGPEKTPGSVLTWTVWDGVVKEFPRAGFKEGVKKVMCGLCETKAETTYGNEVGDFGEAYVEGYSRVGKRLIDVVEALD